MVTSNPEYFKSELDQVKSLANTLEKQLTELRISQTSNVSTLDNLLGEVHKVANQMQAILEKFSRIPVSQISESYSLSKELKDTLLSLDTQVQVMVKEIIHLDNTCNAIRSDFREQGTLVENLRDRTAALETNQNSEGIVVENLNAQVSELKRTLEKLEKGVDAIIVSGHAWKNMATCIGGVIGFLIGIVGLVIAWLKD